MDETDFFYSAFSLDLELVLMAQSAINQLLARSIRDTRYTTFPAYLYQGLPTRFNQLRYPSNTYSSRVHIFAFTFTQFEASAGDVRAKMHRTLYFNSELLVMANLLQQ